MRPGIVLLILALIPVLGCQGELKQRTQSTQHMKALERAIHRHLEEKGSWPKSFDDAAPFLGKATELGDTNDKDLAALLKNPLTGDDPGYEYVNPEGERADPNGIVIYQLRNGKRDESLLATHRDGRILKSGE